MRNPWWEGLKAAWQEFLTPPEGIIKDLAIAGLIGAALFFIVGAVNMLAIPGVQLQGFATVLSGAAFVMCFTGASEWFKPVGEAFSNAFSQTREANAYAQSLSQHRAVSTPSLHARQDMENDLAPAALPLSFLQDGVHEQLARINGYAQEQPTSSVQPEGNCHSHMSLHEEHLRLGA